MGFNFDTSYDSDNFMSFRSLMKNNNAMFKSSKQAQFFITRARKIGDFEISNFGLDFEDKDSNMIIINATMQWADYGTRSIIPVYWAFVIDQYGIKKEYRLGVYGNLRDGSGIAPKKTKQMWSRPLNAVLPEFEEIEKKAAKESPFVNSKHIGDVGERINMRGVVTSVREFQGTAFHYYDSGLRIQTVINVDGNQVVYWNALKDAEVGDIVEFSAKIKDFTVYKEVKQTIISRATKIVVTKKEEQTC